MKDLQLSLYGLSDAKDNRHPQQIMKDLGITYLYAVPQSIADCWQYFCCENVPEVLPEYITEMSSIPPHDRIGYGLSKDMADAIVQKRTETKPDKRCAQENDHVKPSSPSQQIGGSEL